MTLAEAILERLTTDLEKFKGGPPEFCEHLNDLIYAINCIIDAARKSKGAGAAGGGQILPHFIQDKNENGVFVRYNVYGQRAQT